LRDLFRGRKLAHRSKDIFVTLSPTYRTIEYKHINGFLIEYHLFKEQKKRGYEYETIKVQTINPHFKLNLKK
jgi:hypothetical protein